MDARVLRRLASNSNDRRARSQAELLPCVFQGRRRRWGRTACRRSLRRVRSGVCAPIAPTSSSSSRAGRIDRVEADTCGNGHGALHLLCTTIRNQGHGGRAKVVFRTVTRKSQASSEESRIEIACLLTLNRYASCATHASNSFSSSGVSATCPNERVSAASKINSRGMSNSAAN